MEAVSNHCMIGGKLNMYELRLFIVNKRQFFALKAIQ